MKMNNVLKSFAILSTFALAIGCAGTREVEVAGEATSASTVSGKISIEFFDITDAESDPVSVRKIELDALGAFSEKVEVEGDTIRVWGLADANGDGKCTPGEAWAQVDLEVEDDAVPATTLELNAENCPAADVAE